MTDEHPVSVPRSSDPQADAMIADPEAYFAGVQIGRLGKSVVVDAGQRGYASFVAREPVMAAAVVTWVLSNVGAVLLGHTHLVTAEQWGAVTTYVTPLATAAVLAAIGAVVRRYVTPAWKRYTGADLELAEWLAPAKHRPLPGPGKD